MDDLAVVEDSDLTFFGMNKVQRRRFLQLADRQAWSYELQQQVDRLESEVASLKKLLIERETAHFQEKEASGGAPKRQTKAHAWCAGVRVCVRACAWVIVAASPCAHDPRHCPSTARTPPPHAAGSQRSAGCTPPPPNH